MVHLRVQVSVGSYVHLAIQVQACGTISVSVSLWHFLQACLIENDLAISSVESHFKQ